MALATWWRGDVLPTLAPLPDFHVEAARDELLIARVTGLDPAQVRERFTGGHQPYLAYIGAAAVGYGWLAQQEAEIGELGMRFALPPADRYLWDFATLPAWQGYGIYPRLLQRILRQQALPVERMWIIYAPENTPSGAGMRKAGLLPVGHLSFRSDGAVELAVSGALQRAQVGADLLGVSISASVLAPCWACGRATHDPLTDADATGCWPPPPSTATRCTCAVELQPAKTIATAGAGNH